MNLNEQQLQLLNQLQDIQLPEPVGWWPLSAAWWMLIFMVSTILIGLIWYYFDQKKRNAYRDEALERLATVPLTQSDGTPKSPNQQVLEINTLLKQVALTAYTRNDVAQLNDKEWLAFLNRTARHINPPQKIQKTLQLAYQPVSQDPDQIAEDRLALYELTHYARQWIKGHHQ